MVLNDCSCRKEASLPKGLNCLCLYLFRPSKDANDERGVGQRAEKGPRRANLSDIWNSLEAALKPPEESRKRRERTTLGVAEPQPQARVFRARTYVCNSVDSGKKSGHNPA